MDLGHRLDVLLSSKGVELDHFCRRELAVFDTDDSSQHLTFSVAVVGLLSCDFANRYWFGLTDPTQIRGGAEPSVPKEWYIGTFGSYLGPIVRDWAVDTGQDFLSPVEVGNVLRGSLRSGNRHAKDTAKVLKRIENESILEETRTLAAVCERCVMRRKVQSNVTIEHCSVSFSFGLAAQILGVSLLINPQDIYAILARGTTMGEGVPPSVPK